MIDYLFNYSSGLFSWILIIAIIIVFGIGMALNIIWLKKGENRKEDFAWIKISNTILLGFWILEYLYVLLARLKWIPTLDPVFFGATFVRPLVLLTGFLFVASGYIRIKYEIIYKK